MAYTPNCTYHVYNQGINRKRIFQTREDYLIFLRLLGRELTPVCDMLAWCLMPNHFHLLIHTDNRCVTKIQHGNFCFDPVSSGIRKLLSSTCRILNARNGTSGSMFRQGTKKKCLDAEIRFSTSHRTVWDDYHDCFVYIHRNPLEAGLVNDLRDWEFSSYPDYAGLRHGRLVNRDLAIRLLHLDLKDVLRDCNIPRALS